MPHTGINAAAVRIMFADGHVIDPHQRGEQTHGRNEPERTVTAHGKSQADDVSLAGSPIAIKNGGGSRPIHIARALRITGNHKWPDRQTSAAGSNPDTGVQDFKNGSRSNLLRLPLMLTPTG